MRLPHENYIRFLITTGLDSEETKDHLEELGLPFGVVEYWDQQYQVLHDSKVPKQIKSYWDNMKGKAPKNFLEYMSSLGLKEAWLYNAGKNKLFSIAIDAVKDPTISLYVRVLLTLRLPKEEISAMINGKFAMAFPVGAIELYEKYLFNPKIMSRENWRGYLALLPQEEKVSLYKALNGREMEVRADLELPNRVSVSEHYQQIHIYAVERFKRLRDSNNPDTDAQALKWASLAMSSGDKYEKLKLGDATDFGKDLQMEFEFINTEFPTIGQESMEQVLDNKGAGQNTASDSVPLELGLQSDDDEREK